MIVFKTFLKVLRKCIGMILLYTIILFVFAGFNMSNTDNMGTFQEEKPDVFILNEDDEVGLTKNLVDFFRENTVVKDIEIDHLSDALFYRDVNFILKIPKGYRLDVLQGKNPTLEIQSTGDYQSSLAKLLLEKYQRIQTIYLMHYKDETKVIEKLNETLKKEADLHIHSNLDSRALSNAKFYFNFSNYTILAGLVYVVCMILNIFKTPNIYRRTIVSSMNYKRYNRILFLSNGLLAFFLWLFYVLFSFVFVGSVMLSFHGLLFMLNSFIFSFCALSISFFIGCVIRSKEAISGIVNVVALGSSFLCGAFVPTEFLPNSVLLFSHILPSYWFIHANESISILEHFQISYLLVIFLSMGVLILFTCVFFVLSNIVSRKNLARN